MQIVGRLTTAHRDRIDIEPFVDTPEQLLGDGRAAAIGAFIVKADPA